MIALRRLLLHRPALAAAIVAAALLLRLVVPAGFMPMLDAGRVVVGVCNGTGAATMVIDLPGHTEDGAAAKGACAFSDLSLPLVGGADVTLLLAAFAFAVALALRVAPPFTLARARFLLPPLRGPPAA